MASKPTVELTLSGDEKKLTEAFARVGQASKGMADDVDRSSKDMVSASGDAQGRLTEGFDTTDTRAMGFRDTITGLQDGFKGLSDDSLGLGERLLLLGTGVGDLASGMVNFVIPTLASFGRTLFTKAIPAVWGFTTALLANPLTWIVLGIIALIAAIVLMIVHWDKVKAVVSNVIRWIRDRWNGIVDWFKGIPGRIGAALGNIGTVIGNVFKGAINFLIDGLNWGIDRVNDLIHGINAATSLIPGVGAIPDIPHVSRLHGGGVVPGMVGSEQMMMLQAGERVIPRGQDGNSGGGRLEVVGDADGAVATMIKKLIRDGVLRLA